MIKIFKDGMSYKQNIMVTPVATLLIHEFHFVGVFKILIRYDRVPTT